MPKPVVLIIDDEPDLLELISLTLGRMSLETRTAPDLASARRQLATQHFDLCLTDMRLPDGDGLDLVAWIQANCPTTPVAVITAHGNVESAVRALKLGAFDFVSKPLDLGVLRKLVGTAIRLGSLGENTQRGPGLLGSSPIMQQLREMIAKVARSQAPVYIYGESGTGKELVARLIHQSGARAEAPLHTGQLRRHSHRTHGKRALRSQARQLYGRGGGQEGPDPGGRRGAPCFWTRWPTCRCTCR